MYATDKEEDFRIAIHEAGHAVVAHVLGMPLEGIEFKKGTMCGRRYDAATRLAPTKEEDAAFDALRRHGCYDFAFSKDTMKVKEDMLLIAIRHVMVGFGGLCAEEIRYGSAEPSWQHDMDGVVMITEIVCPFGGQEDVSPVSIDGEHVQEAAIFTVWLQLRAKKILRANMNAVESVAKALAEKRKLTGEEVARLVDTARAADTISPHAKVAVYDL